MTSARPHGSNRFGRPLAALFLGSGAVAVTLGAVRLACQVHNAAVVRIREQDLFWVVRRSLDAFDVNLLARLPDLCSWSFDLNVPGATFVFAAFALTASLLLAWTLAAIAAPVVLAMRWASRSMPPSIASWFWQRAFPVSVLVGFATPTIFVIVHATGLGDRIPHGGAFVVTAAIALALWAVLLLVLRRPAFVDRFVTLLGAVGAIIATFTWIGAAIAHVHGPGSHRAAQPLPLPGRPNVLLVSIDSLRRDHVHCYGYPRDTTPAIDRLAREGTRFETAVSPAPWTLPAHLTLLTAMPPEEHGVVDDGLTLHRSAVFLAQVFWNAGYATAGFVSSPYLDAAYGFSQGFDHYDDYTIAKMGLLESNHESSTSPVLVDLVTQWLGRWDRAGRQRAFFLFMHMWDVHYDYTPPPPYDSLFDPDYHGLVTGVDFINNPAVRPDMPARDLAHVVALYDGEIRYTDSYLDKLLAELSRMGVIDNTIVAVTADHGDEFFDHGQKGHCKTLYDELLLVPLVIRFPPRVPAGRVVRPQVRLMDVAPTILGLAGVDRPSDFGSRRLDGPEGPQDLTAWLDESAVDRQPGLPAFGDLELSDVPRRLASIRTEAAKLIRPLRAAEGMELYDLQADPTEHHNLAGEPGVATPLPERLASWRKRWEVGAALAREVELGQEQRARLQALGYLQ